MEKIKKWCKEHRFELMVGIGGLSLFASGMLLGYKMGEIDAMLEFNTKLAREAEDALTEFFKELDTSPEEMEIMHHIRSQLQDTL